MNALALLRAHRLECSGRQVPVYYVMVDACSPPVSTFPPMRSFMKKLGSILLRRAAFLIYGERINPNQLPDDLELEDNGIVNCVHA